MVELFKEKKKAVLVGISFGVSALVFFFAVFIWQTLGHGSVAWFSQNKTVDASGLTLNAENDNIFFGDIVRVSRSNGPFESTEYYKRDTGGRYLLCNYDPDTDTYTYPEDPAARTQIALTGLFPNEVIDIVFDVKCVGDSEIDYQLLFDGINDDNGLFVLNRAEGDTDSTVSERTHSVLGIYNVATVENDTAIPCTPNAWLLNYEETETSGIYRDVYNCRPFHICDGVISPGETVTVNIRISVDFTPYNELPGITPNLLSLKEFSIGSLRLVPVGAAEVSE